MQDWGEREMSGNKGRKKDSRMLAVAAKDSGDLVEGSSDLDQECTPAVGVALSRDDVGKLVQAEGFVVQPLAASEADPAAVIVCDVGVGFGSEAGADAAGDAATDEEALDLRMLERGRPARFP